MVPFTCLLFEGHLAKVCTEKRDYINEGICSRHDLVVFVLCLFLEISKMPSISCTWDLTFSLLLCSTLLGSVRCCAVFQSFPTECFSNWVRQPYHWHVDLSCEQTNNSFNNALLFFSTSHFEVKSSCCCVIIFQLENVHTCVHWLSGGVLIGGQGSVAWWPELVCPGGSSIRSLGSHDVANALPLAPSHPPAAPPSVSHNSSVSPLSL